MVIIMCLSAVYQVREGNESIVCEHTTAISIDGDNITLTDIVGEEIVIIGVITSIDLIRNIIKIEVSG